MENTSRFYNIIYPLYPVIDFFFLKQKKILASIINDLPFGNLLEVGVGNGSMLPMYTKHTVSGIDLSIKMLSVAKKRKTKVPVQLFLMDGKEMKFGDSSFDYIIINHTLSVVKEPGCLLDNCYRVLKPSGKLIILNHFTPANILGLIDIMLIPLSGLLHFKSYFPLSGIKALGQFQLQYKIPSKPLGYYQIVVLEK
jgi:phosphatidylethanolamine/phosphatidyl-N-methylethanolamine N-methyltransferase